VTVCWRLAQIGLKGLPAEFRDRRASTLGLVTEARIERIGDRRVAGGGRRVAGGFALVLPPPPPL
jgi:hypothetical protein